MRVTKTKSRSVGAKVYSKYRVHLPSTLVSTLGWEDEPELEHRVFGDELRLKRAPKKRTRN